MVLSSAGKFKVRPMTHHREDREQRDLDGVPSLLALREDEAAGP